jgi:UrcA family protein
MIFSANGQDRSPLFSYRVVQPRHALGITNDQTEESSTMNAIIRTKIHAAIYCVLGAAALGALSTSAHAEDQPPSKTVKFADLDIQTPEGAKVLYHRIRAAARSVCDYGHANLRNAELQCAEKAIDDAVRKVNAPYPTVLHVDSTDRLRLASK